MLSPWPTSINAAYTPSALSVATEFIAPSKSSGLNMSISASTTADKMDISFAFPLFGTSSLSVSSFFSSGVFLSTITFSVALAVTLAFFVSFALL